MAELGSLPRHSDLQGLYHNRKKGQNDTQTDRNGMNLTEAEDIKKRWKEYTEELHTHTHTQIFMTQITMMV